MKNRILAIAALTAVSLGFAAAGHAQSSSSQTCYTNSRGNQQCDYQHESATESTSTRCVFVGSNHKCESDAPKSKVIYPPSIEHVRIGGKTINVLRGMPTKPAEE